MSHLTQEVSTNSSISFSIKSQSDTPPKNPKILKRNPIKIRTSPHQKAILINRCFFNNKKIIEVFLGFLVCFVKILKKVAKDLKINYCTAKSIITAYRKNKGVNFERLEARRCSFRQISKKNYKMWTVVSKVCDNHKEINVEKKSNEQFLCPLGNVESYVEKFLLIKNIERKLTNLNYNYMVEFEGSKAVFWCQQRGNLNNDADIIPS